MSTNIDCTNNCSYQQDGKCTLTKVTANTISSCNNKCPYQSSVAPDRTQNNNFR